MSVQARCGRVATQILASLAMAAPWMAAPVLAGSLLPEVGRSGVLVAGTSKDAFPFAYQDSSGQLVGYSVDMMDLVRKELERKTGRPIQLRLVALEPDQRIESLRSGAVNLICDASSFTWARDQKVDFSVSYGITGTQLLVPAGSGLSSPASIAGRRIGAMPGTTNAIAVRRQQPSATLVVMQDREEAYQALREGRIDAFADDGMLLYAWLQRQEDADQYRVSQHTYSREGIACMLPKNDSDFAGTVNLALIRHMKGFLDRNPQSQAIFDRWFGPQSETPVTQDIREVFVETMQLMVDFKEDPPN